MTPYCLLLATIIGTTVGIKEAAIRGITADPGDFPSIVSIHNHIGHFCAGSIYNKNWVVTAAHCLDLVTTSAVIVSGTTLKDDGDWHRIVYWVGHKDYDNTTYINDIGLIKIEDTFEFNDVTYPLKLINPQENWICTVAGWGWTENTHHPMELQYVLTRVLSLQACKINTYFFDKRQICTLAGAGHGSCKGDSGGPLVCNGNLAGIVSHGNMPCAHGKPDYYTRVAAYEDWIQDTIHRYYDY